MIQYLNLIDSLNFATGDSDKIECDSIGSKVVDVQKFLVYFDFAEEVIVAAEQCEDADAKLTDLVVIQVVLPHFVINLYEGEQCCTVCVGDLNVGPGHLMQNSMDVYVQNYLGFHYSVEEVFVYVADHFHEMDAQLKDFVEIQCVLPHSVLNSFDGKHGCLLYVDQLNAQHLVNLHLSLIF
ncbi:unnamed protein product [Meloidogyne enterolobii]|uniref:Uncharacterized protein n=1 Tax=Meloidogyne enterolobii TaxID=390850 RepID=A0ACB1AW58_MELEN